MRKLLLIPLILVAALFSVALHAENYPSRPITLVAVFGPGSASDTICRIIANELSPMLGQPIVVEDRPGADGALAALYVHHQPADGYTLLMGTNSPLSADPFIHKDINYDPIKDFVPITRVGSFTLMLVVNPTLPIHSVKELVEYAKANPGKLTYASGNTALAAKNATNTIPIVVVAMADPVRDGLVASLARPGGNITGSTFLGPELIPKRLGLLKQVVPGASRVAVLWHPGVYSEQTMKEMVGETEEAARTLGVQLQFLGASSPSDLDEAFSAASREHAEALLVFPSPMLYLEYKHIVDLVTKNRPPAMYPWREAVDAGGLMSYGASIPDLIIHAAVQVGKILKGAEPAELPIEQPTKFELVINLKAATALGLSISRDFLLIADEVIN